MKSLVCWSGGKDSALALHETRRRGGVDVVGLLTTLSAEFDRISMHGVRRELLEAQAAALGLPVEKVLLPTPPPDAPCPVSIPRPTHGFTVFATNDSYEEKMLEALTKARDQGIEGIVFGDIFLEDLRRYRERLLAQVGLKGVFPLWGRETKELLNEALDLGFQAIIVCVDSKKLGESWVGRLLDERFLRDLPEGVDPCGERGEFHTFVFNGPGFRHPVPVVKGESVFRDPFWFCDLETASVSAIGE
ncbi:MAG: diphthine--ammonia ligase [Thermoanaerobaculia bacterium]